MNGEALPEVQVAKDLVEDKEPKISEETVATKTGTAPECDPAPDIKVMDLNKTYNKVAQFGYRSTRKNIRETMVCKETTKLVQDGDSEVDKQGASGLDTQKSKDWAAIVNEQKLTYRAGNQTISANPAKDVLILKSATDRKKLLVPMAHTGASYNAYNGANGFNGYERIKAFGSYVPLQGQ